jgi:exopolysaccharide biosynthesis protein
MRIQRFRNALLISALILTGLVGGHAQEFKTVRDGVEYAELLKETPEGPIRGNLLRLDLSKVRLDVVHAKDAAIGVERTSAMAQRYGALAAINTGFFRLDSSIFAGTSVGAIQIDGVRFADSYAARVALLISNTPNRTEARIERLDITTTLSIAKNPSRISILVNRERKNDEAVLFTPEFGRSTLSSPGGVEFIVRRGKVESIVEGRGSNVIPADGFVISAHGKRREELITLLKKGSRVSVHVASSLVGGGEPGVAARYEDIIAGVPQLIRNGVVDVTWKDEKSSKGFSETKHPRSAAAILKDGRLLLVAIDGRQPGHSIGIGLDDLANILLEMGAVQAMNFDGGGSTAMYLDGKVVNKPSDKEGERYVSDALLVTVR